MASTRNELMDSISGLVDSLLDHDGFGDMRIEVRLLKRGQKEVIVHCGRQYRFVLDGAGARKGAARTTN